MGDAVKDTRRGGRREQTKATRRRIVDAAAALFIAEGYTATKLDRIAEQAGVAVQTVYFHFGNKRTVLKEAVDIAAVGDDEPVPMLDRPLYRQFAEERDPERLIALFVQGATEILGRIAPIMGVVRDAAGADPDMSEQWQTNQEQRAVAFRVFAQRLADVGALQDGMSVDDATDILLALASIEVYLLLAARGWSPQRWERWITAMILAALL